MRRSAASFVAFALVVASESVAVAADPPPYRALDPKTVQGIDAPEHQPGDSGREVAAALTFLPRKAVDFLFFATGTAAGLIRDEQVVPRVEELLSPRPGEVTLLPMVFLDTRQRPSVGAAMLARGDNAATSLAAGYGGPRDQNFEARVRLGRAHPVPVLFAGEMLADQRSSLDYLGVGQEPDGDPRNLFAKNAPAHAATYLEQRTRVLGSLGIRPQSDIEVFVSSSYNKSHVLDTPDSAAPMSRVFVPGSVPGFPGDASFFYNEVAVRLDTRPTLGTPSPGVFVETYAGIGTGTRGDPTRFARTGGRVALFIPIVKRTTIVSPRIALDGVAPLGDGLLPFTQLAAQPDYRGLDNRRDRVSLVGSLDYRFMVTHYVAMRLFGDAATVGPEIKALFDHRVRLDAGLGVDLFSASTELGQAAFSYSNDGVRLLFTFGIPSAFGDRQHRY